MTRAAAALRGLCRGWQLEMEIKWFFLQNKSEKNVTFKKERERSRDTRAQKLYYNTLWSFSCETGAAQSLQKSYCIVVDGFLNWGVQSGQVILRIKNMSGYNVGSILCCTMGSHQPSRGRFSSDKWLHRDEIALSDSSLPFSLCRHTKYNLIFLFTSSSLTKPDYSIHVPVHC